MFTKLDITKFGLFHDFRWTIKPFQRVNIIYGRNYAGKTTLSRIFDCVGQGQLHKDYTDGQFKLYTDQSATPEVTNSNLNYDGLVRVYNADFVNRNLGWLKDEDTGEIKSFALLGEGNMKAQEEIEAIDARLGSVEKKSGLLYTYEIRNAELEAKTRGYNDALGSLDWQLKNKANGDIKRKSIFVKQGATYNVNNIQRDIDSIVKEDMEGKYTLDGSVVLTEDKKRQLECTINETEKNRIERLPETEHHVVDYVTKVKGLVSKSITLTKTLRELVENELLQAWVDNGRKLNKDRETCAFCGSPITKERWDALDAHFSKESEDLKNALQEERVKLTVASQALDEYLDSKGFKKENIYASLQGEFERVVGEWNTYVARYKDAIGTLIMLIDERLDNIFKPVEVEQMDIEVGSVGEIIKSINILIEKNNEFGLKLEQAKQGARDELRLDYVYGFCVDIKYSQVKEQLAREEVELKGMEREVRTMSSEINLLRNQRNQKELEKKDEGKAAQKITKLLVSHFGNGSLRLEPEQVEDIDEETGEMKPRTRFVVKRGVQNAKNLSEGERSLISFCYFIAQMDDELSGEDASRLVIFIDDPISSLDSSHIFFMYSLIDSVIAEPKKYGQLFISTHNLEFLKFLKRLKLPGERDKKELEYYVVEKLRKGDADDYKSVVKEMPVYLKNYVTEYNFLFQQVYDVAKPIIGDKKALYGNSYSQYYNVGNNMRKFLECYLFYRYPNCEDPIKNHMKKLFDGEVPSELNRVINEYSHLAWAERGLRVIDVPEIEKAAKLILDAIRTKDPEHFAVLCQSVDRDENVDLS